MTAVEQLPAPPMLREGGVIWVTGLAESGKTTVSEALVAQIRRIGVKPVHLDGNIMREAIGETRSFDRASRRKMAYTYARLGRMLAAQGQLVICSTISLFHDVHEWNRKNIDRYFEVFLDVPLRELKRRDSKGVYRESNDAEIVGIGVTPEFPVNPDLEIANHSDIHPEAAASRILSACTSASSR
ncbi:adenylyl-sulfate kinase [Streptomyces sp. NPDC048518]|uniref:adenylyl-sulfate kinase n=1 Tax=Streptomyces sp. NPDC048518 TaxID=3155029 RepID=UPI0034063C43